MNTKIFLFFPVILFLTACYNPKIQSLQNQLSTKSAQVTQLEQQIQHMQETNSSILDRMADLSIVNKTEAESIKNSLESLNRQQQYIAELADIIEGKDSVNNALVSNLRRSLHDFNDQDVQIEVRGSAVYVSLSDRLLFNTASSRILPSAHQVLEKVARIINDNDQLNVLVEGHTDNVPISNDRFADNWELSVLRATSVVKMLQIEFYVTPARLTAAGRGEYVPKTNNYSITDKQQNRRTEIILTPKLDQFFSLLEEPGLVG